ncbi:MAG: PAS domain-containing protein [Elusimicrobiales bacterium]|nr:PAS domain-containing protein [Elusimicrobiales bacterium]
MKLTTRFFLILLIISVIPMMISVSWNVHQYHSTANTFFDLHKAVSNLAAANIDEWLQRVNRSFAFLYEIENPLKRTKVDENKIIKQATTVNSEIMALSFIGVDGKPVFELQSKKIKSKKHLSVYNKDLVAEANETGKVALGDVLCIENDPYFPLAYPLINGKTVLFYFSLSNLWDKLISQKTGKSGKVIIVNEKGKLLGCQDSKNSKYNVKHIQETFLESGKSGFLKDLKIGGEKYSGSYSRAEGLPWVVVSLQSNDEIYGPRRRAIIIFSIFTLVTLAISILIMLMISKKIIQPINNIMHSVKYFLRDQRLDKVIPREGWPEIKNLVSILNRLMLELQAYRAFQLNQIVEEKNKAQALIDTIPDGVLLIDNANRLIYSNGVALRLLNIPKISPDIIIPNSVANRDFNEKLSVIVTSKEKLMETEVYAKISLEPPVSKSFRIISRQFMLETLKRPGRVIILRDISDEKELEKAREDFFHMITHDMRAPLSTIQGYVELLIKIIPKAERTDKYLKSMLYSSRRLRGMIDDILNTTKLEKGTLMLQTEEIDAQEFLDRIVENHEPVAGPKKIELSSSLPARNFKFFGDHLMLERVITNLVGNSLKFTPKGGHINLSAEENESEIRISVEDNGPGIPEKQRKSIFEKGSQMEEHKSMGFGLGLAMCSMTVNLHGGKIWVESEVGKGSKFIFTVSKALNID